ncbi:MAG: hypothetical protein QM770_15540 [Tepidisphaeraceae bacterium]
MPLLVPTLAFLISSAFFYWIIFRDGADRLDGTWFSGFALWYRAPELNPTGLRIVAGILWAANAYWLALRLFIYATK